MVSVATRTWPGPGTALCLVRFDRVNGLWPVRVELGIYSVNRKLALSALMLFGALACIGVSIALFVGLFSESSSLFVTAAETVRGGDETQQYRAMICMAIGLAIMVFVRKSWR